MKKIFSLFFLVLLSILTHGCVSKPEVKKCDFSSIDIAISRPLDVIGRYFCGEVYVFFDDQHGAKFTQGLRPDENSVVVKTSNLAKFTFQDVNKGEKYYIEGLFNIDGVESCFGYENINKKLCLPDQYPLYIKIDKYTEIDN